MKRKIALLVLSTLIISVTAFTLTSCGGGGGKEKPTPSGSTVTPSVSSLGITSGSSASLTITATASWTATASSSDVKVSPNKGGKGKTTVTISLAKDASQNSYTVTFKCGSNKSVVTITKGGSAASIKVTPAEVIIAAEAGTGTATITCSGSWTVSVANKPDWVTDVKPTSGQGNGTVTITTKANTERIAKSYIMEVSSGSYKASIVVAKQAAGNKPPTKPTNLAPTGGVSQSVDRFPEFTWTASTDPDNDEIKYTVMYSLDNTNWTSLDAGTTTKIIPKKSLEPVKHYYWKVVANDGYTGGKVESDVVSFYTGTQKKYYDDCEVVEYKKGTAGSKEVVIIFTGDGYTQDLYEYGGQFDQEMDAGIAALFAIEPYNTYINYFTVYKVAAYSNEAGMSSGSTEWEKATNKVDTRFKCSWEGGNSTGIGCDENAVISVVKNVPGIKDATTDQELLNKLSWSPTSILINTNQYAGTNIFYRGLNGMTVGGFGILSIAQTPARHPKVSGDSWNTLRHEFGGHGFGLLADEYVYYGDQTIPASDKSNRQAWKSYGLIGCYGNVTFINDPEQCEWAQFIGREEYAAAKIGLYEGALMYGLGVWRSELTSCMIDNRPHFNTQSRWQIYRRIKITAGETPTLEDFIAHDYDKVQSFSQAPATKAAGSRIPYPPIMYDEYGRRVK